MVNRQCGKHEEYVITYRGKPMARLNNSGFRAVRERVGLECVRVHDLRHTTGRRLRAAGVSNETRKDILGHEGGNITTHYLVAEIGELVEAVEKIAVESSESSPSLTLIRIGGSKPNHAKFTQKKELGI